MSDDEPMRDRTTIHISIHEAATSDEADAFFDDLGEWVGAWMEAHPAIQWEPFVWSHTESCVDSDHCHGPGSWVERRIAARALREAAGALPGFDGIRTHGDAARWLRVRADDIHKESA